MRDGELSRGRAGVETPRVALFCLRPEIVLWLAPCVTEIADIVELFDIESLDEHSRQAPLAAVVADGTSVRGHLDRLLARLGGDTPVLLTEPAPAIDPRVFYVLRRTMAPGDIAEILRSALAPSSPQQTAPAAPVAPEDMQQILLAASRFVGAKSLASAAEIAEVAMSSFVTADRARCLFHDHALGILWRERGEGRERYPTIGLAGFVARTGRALALSDPTEDPRYDPRVDDLGGKHAAHLLVIPVGDRDGVHAVFLATRTKSPFPAVERDRLLCFAERSGPLMRHITLLVAADAQLRAQNEELFRNESFSARAGGGQRGDVIRVMPHWVRWAYWLLVALTSASVVYMVVGEVDQYSSGPAIVRLHERTELSARGSGPLLAVQVEAGEHVEAGALLARLDDSGLRSELHRVQREFDTQLRNRMLDPADASAAQALIALRGEEQSVRGRLAQLQLRAPRAGTISDLRTRPGQHIDVGDVVMSLIHDDERPRLIALLPGADRPQLRQGMTLRLELEGFRYGYQTLTLDEVGNEVIGPAEAKRFLGPQLADTVPLMGPVVVVSAALPETTFKADGKAYRYYDGMIGTADIRIRTETILELLFPPLKRLDSDD